MIFSKSVAAPVRGCWNHKDLACPESQKKSTVGFPFRVAENYFGVSENGMQVFTFGSRAHIAFRVFRKRVSEVAFPQRFKPLFSPRGDRPKTGPP